MLGSARRTQTVAQKPARPERLLTETELARYDGSDPTSPIYVALDGSVFDVTSGRATYGPGGAYHHFAGRDAARAFITGCFKTHLTHDLRGLDARQLEVRAPVASSAARAIFNRAPSPSAVGNTSMRSVLPYVEHCRGRDGAPQDHARYFRIGRVLHEPIDPDSPIPEDCNAKSEGGAS
jgi:predicted heme/steroid binding protein